MRQRTLVETVFIVGEQLELSATVSRSAAHSAQDLGHVKRRSLDLALAPEIAVTRVSAGFRLFFSTPM
jgi:hypothetical protein